ncbi:MAG: redoxin domain-containing protein [Longimicrobiales bacterium]|nr:redoxin domain-containing protein [Longimicrobiales bacterium]
MNQRKTWVFFAGILLAAGLVVLMAWVNRDSLNPVVAGGPAPDFATYDLQGTSRSLEDYRGKVVLLNIWATWCTPCKEEMPSMQRLYEEIRDEEFQVLAVSIDRAPSDYDPKNPLDGKLRAFADSLGLTFTILHDPSGEITTTYQTTGVPESFVLDRDGIIFKKITGPMAWDAPQNVQFIERLLEGGADPTQ